MSGFLLLMAGAAFFVLSVSPYQKYPPPLEKSEEKKLFLEMKKEGNTYAREKLIEHNLRLVSHIVRKYYASSPQGEDLFSIGSVGLIKSIDSYNCESGVRFATYAARCIQNEILMYFRSQKKLSGEVSINETIDTDRDGNPLTYIDIIRCDDTIAEDLSLKMESEKIVRLMKMNLTQREREVLIMRFGLNAMPAMTQREAAEKLGISRSYVSRIEKGAIEKLREGFLPNL